MKRVCVACLHCTISSLMYATLSPRFAPFAHSARLTVELTRNASISTHSISMFSRAPRFIPFLCASRDLLEHALQTYNNTIRFGVSVFT